MPEKGDLHQIQELHLRQFVSFCLYISCYLLLNLLRVVMIFNGPSRSCCKYVHFYMQVILCLPNQGAMGLVFLALQLLPFGRLLQQNVQVPLTLILYRRRPQQLQANHRYHFGNLIYRKQNFYFFINIFDPSYITIL